MNPDAQIGNSDEATSAFEQTLEHLVLDAFADGIDVEGTWDVTVPVADAPGWSVTIEKSYSEESTAYQPNVLEE